MSSEAYIKSQIQKIKTQLKEEPKNASLLNDLGVGYYLVGEHEKAIAPLEKATKINQNKSAYLFNLANAYSGLEEYSLAQKFYLDALDLEPDHIPSLTNLADCYEMSGEPEKAEELFRYVTNLAPENALAFFNLGNFQLRQNQHIKAVKNYEKAISLEKSFVDAYFNIAWVLTEAKAFEEALPYAKKGAKLDPNHTDLKEILYKIRSNIR